jgi:hypothetical protein
MRHAAKVLGLLADDGTVTAAGRALASLPETRTLDFLSLQFELSVVGQLWKKWANVTDLLLLDQESAVKFLLNSGFHRSMAERRGRTLRKWLQSFKSLRRGPSTA